MVDPATVIARLGGRRSCVCGETYHVSTHPSPICDKCGATLFVRDDDKEEIILNRLAVYEKTTAPLQDFYAQRGVLVNVNAAKSVDEVFDEIKSILG